MWDSIEKPAEPVERPVVEQVVLLQPMVSHSAADLHAAAHGGACGGAGGPGLEEAAAYGEPLLSIAM